MEPSKIHSTTLPQQELTQPVEGCLSGLRPADLLRGGQEVANPLVGQQVAIDAVDSATAGTLQPPGVSENMQGEELTTFTRLKAYSVLVDLGKKKGKKVRPPDLPIQDRLAVILEALSLPSDLKDEANLKLLVWRFTYQCETMYKTCKYSLSRFTNKHKLWLNGDFEADFLAALPERPHSILEPVGSSGTTCSESVSQPATTCENPYPDSIEKPDLGTKKPHLDSISDPDLCFEKPCRELVIESGSCLERPSIDSIIETTPSSDKTCSDAIVGLVPSLERPCSDLNLTPGPSNLNLEIRKSLDQSCSDAIIKSGSGSVTLSDLSNYENLGERQRRRVHNNLKKYLEKEPPKKVTKVFANTVEVEGQKLSKKVTKDFEYVMNTCLQSSTKPTEIANIIRTNPTPYTPDEALAIFIDRKFSVETYHFLQQDLKAQGFNALPPYYQVREAKKQCYPTEPVTVTEREASIPLFSLLSHTFNRIVQSCETTFSHYCNQQDVETLNCVFEGSWGFDGSSGQSLYKQKFLEGEEGDESTIFATTFIPLQIKTECGQVLWINPTPQSYRYCRPIHIQYRKETKDLIMAEKEFVENKINNLHACVTQTSNGQTITAKIRLYLTVIDGKVLNIITNTMSQLRCPFCKATSSQFNDLDLVFPRTTDQSLLIYGISPLHAWIRVLEFLLNLAYKNPIKKWRVSKKSPEARVVAETKKHIQDEIRAKLGLLVDIVRPNSGTTNDGNTARTALSDKNRSVFANILGLQQWLVDDLHVILVVMSSGLPVNTDKFGDFCKSLAMKYVQEYDWHPMTVTIHKILVHGKEIMENSTLPLGFLSEQAGEARNKFWRSDREHHTRKLDREKTMLDLFNRALESSDPLVSNIRLQKRLKKLKRQPLPVEVMELLKPCELPIEEENLCESSDDYINILEIDETNNIVLMSEECDDLDL